MIATREQAVYETVPCPLCGGAEWRLELRMRDHLYDAPGVFRLVKCRTCGHVFLNPRPTAESIAVFYPDEYAPFGGTSDATASVGRPGSIRRFVRWLLDPRAVWFPPIGKHAPRALELGCADGSFLAELRERGWEAVGVEPSPSAAERARRRGETVSAGTLVEAGFPPDSFDAVFAWMVFEHLHDPRAELAEIRRILKPDGWLVFSVPNYGSWESSAFGEYWYGLHPPQHLQQFTPRTLRRLLESSGYERPRFVHQRSLLNVVGSIGQWLRGRRPDSKPGRRLLAFCNSPTAVGTALLAPAAWLLALLRQGGRLTVVTRVAAGPSES